MRFNRPELFDCDGVLVDFCAHLANATGIEAVRAPSSYYFEDYLDKDQLRLVKRTMKDGDFWRYMPKMAEAPGRLPGNSLVVSKPYQGCRDWFEARKANLRELYRLDPRRVVPLAYKAVVAGSFLVDDAPANVINYRERWGINAGFIFDAPYNRELGDRNRVTWKNGELVWAGA